MERLIAGHDVTDESAPRSERARDRGDARGGRALVAVVPERTDEQEARLNSG
jgi:hypothetical protein